MFGPTTLTRDSSRSPPSLSFLRTWSLERGPTGGRALGRLFITLSQASQVLFGGEGGCRGKSEWGSAGSRGPGQDSWEVRRAASVTIVRSQQVCLLERLSFLAPGAKAAAQWRQTTLRLQERRKREAQAYSLAFQRGGLGREGRAFVP